MTEVTVTRVTTGLSDAEALATLVQLRTTTGRVRISERIAKVIAVVSPVLIAVVIPKVIAVVIADVIAVVVAEVVTDPIADVQSV